MQTVFLNQMAIFSVKKKKTDCFHVGLVDPIMTFMDFSIPFASLSRIENISTLSKDVNNTTVCGGSRQHLSLFTVKYKYKRENGKSNSTSTEAS